METSRGKNIAKMTEEDELSGRLKERKDDDDKRAAGNPIVLDDSTPSPLRNDKSVEADAEPSQRPPKVLPIFNFRKSNATSNCYDAVGSIVLPSVFDAATSKANGLMQSRISGQCALSSPEDAVQAAAAMSGNGGSVGKRKHHHLTEVNPENQESFSNIPPEDMDGAMSTKVSFSPSLSSFVDG